MSPAERAGRLEELYLKIQKDSGYRNNRMGDIFVPGRGALESGLIVLIGEAPGRNEEITGRPFVGAAGKNLDILLDLAGLSREKIFITNVIKYRPVTPDGKNRNPSLTESNKALPFLLEELAILSPRMAACLGLCPARTLLGGNPVMGEVNGKVFRKSGLDILVTYHPSPFNYYSPKKREAMHAVFAKMRTV